MLLNFDQLLHMFGNVKQFYAIIKYTGVCQCTENQAVNAKKCLMLKVESNGKLLSMLFCHHI